MPKSAHKRIKNIRLHMAALTGLAFAVSGCAYGYGDVGYGYNAGGYNAGQCDPYNEFDRYYECDSRYGFVNIGYGGGWYDRYYYPGYGLYLFDNYGRRYSLPDGHRRYWAQQRYQFYQNRTGPHNGGRVGEGRRDNRRDDYRGDSFDGQAGAVRGVYRGGTNVQGQGRAFGQRREQDRGQEREQVRRSEQGAEQGAQRGPQRGAQQGALQGAQRGAQQGAPQGAQQGAQQGQARRFRNFTPHNIDAQGNIIPRSSARPAPGAAVQSPSVRPSRGDPAAGAARITRPSGQERNTRSGRIRRDD